MGRLTFVGLGLGSKGITLEGLQAMRDADIVYLEYYTTPHDPSLIQVLSREVGKEVAIVDRGFVEDGRKIIDDAKSLNVVLASPGDPMIATTHTDLMVRAIRNGVECKVIHSATIASSAASASGLHYYKFGRIITVTNEGIKFMHQVYHVVHKNLLEGLHTLLLLEYDADRKVGVDPQTALMGLLNAEENYKRNVISGKTLVIIMSRVGRPNYAYRIGQISDLIKFDYGEHPHCIIIPGKLHFTELEAISTIFSIEISKIADNTEGLKRTAQVLLPKYVEKLRRALQSISERRREYERLLENVELYMNDAERFLAEGDDELAMLSIGYAEGLLDALNFMNKEKINW